MDIWVGVWKYGDVWTVWGHTDVQGVYSDMATYLPLNEGNIYL